MNVLSYRPSQQIRNVQLIYALIRGGDKICAIIDEPMISDIVAGRDLDENGIAHMRHDPFRAGKDSKKPTGGKGVKKFVNKIGNILSSVVKSDHRHDSELPYVDMNSKKLPLVYIPLLIKRGIKWMERASRDSSGPNNLKRGFFGKSGKPAENCEKSVPDKNLPPTISPEEEPNGDGGVENEDHTLHKSANEAVADLINWIDSESRIYSSDALDSNVLEEKQAFETNEETKNLPETSESDNIILTYEEGPVPEDFFVPYLWSAVVIKLIYYIEFLIQFKFYYYFHYVAAVCS